MDRKIETFNDVLEYLDTKGLFHVDLSLDRMHTALKRLNLEHPSFFVVQILGTNGKGSTSTFLANICQKHNLKTGLYTSPHFVSPLERIKINGRSVAGSDLIEPARIIQATAPDLTYFEFLTIAALLLFQDKVDVAILEAGLGGAHDATTAIPADLICYTPIALDHCQVLGKSLEAIATDKAQAIRSAVPVCTTKQYPKAWDILSKMAKETQASLEVADPLDNTRGFLLTGNHQAINAGLAVLAFQKLASLLKINPSQSLLDLGLKTAFLPGRLQRAAKSSSYPAMILDGGHNPHGVQTVLAALRDGQQPSAVIYAGLDDKDWPSALRLLAQEYRGKIPAYFPVLNNPRASQASKMHDLWYDHPHLGEKESFRPQTVGQILRALALETKSEDYVLVIGSLYLLAEVYTEFPNLLNDPAFG
ncbi:MAG: bifunctional folylpolyglutamate synthase/ dihydrofolate synthase [Desulfovibrionaceae bacterium]|nr:bifunctional folylpolyglutamate synthase/ dihydrofolate synthase [Desulfovibrionaceae bacterium]